MRRDHAQEQRRGTRPQAWNPLLKSYPESERVNALSIGAETLFTRLIARADDFGNYYGSPGLILAYLFGHRMEKGEVCLADTRLWGDELVTQGLAVRYTVDGKDYLHLVNSHRRLRRDVKPRELFPREPADCEQAINTQLPATVRERAGDVTDAGPPRDGNVPLDPEVEEDPEEERERGASPFDEDEAKGPPVGEETEPRKAEGAAVFPLDALSSPSQEASLEPSETRGGVLESEDDPAVRALHYLNQKAGKHFTARPVALQGAHARLKEGASVDDLCLVVDYKVAEWSGGDLAKWLRPETLFSAKHWDAYIHDAREWDGKGRPQIVWDTKVPSSRLVINQRPKGYYDHVLEEPQER